MGIEQTVRDKLRAKVLSRRIVIVTLECTFPEENVSGACSGKTRH